MSQATEIAESVRSGRLRAADVLSDALDRARSHSELNAWIHTDAPATIGKSRGLMAGVPVVLKDNIAQKNAPCTCGSHILEGYIAPYNAHVVDLLLEDGASILGRCNMDEFGMGSTTEHSIFGPCLNPWDKERVPGGSSGGAAALVSAGVVPIGIGSSTGGSVRQPAAYCGVVGFKPTYGRISRRGLVAYASSLDVVAPIGATVKDAALALESISGADPLDETECSPGPIQALKAVSRGLEGLRVGILEEGLSENNSPDINAGIHASADALEAAGAQIERVSLGSLHRALATYYILAPAEASSNLSRFDGIRYGPRQAHNDLDSLYTQNRTLGFGPEVKRRILMGTYCLSAGYYDAYYRKALQHQAFLRERLSTIFCSVDLLLLPTTPDTAPRIGALADPMKMKLSDIYTVLANLTGVPAISVPCGLSEGMPMGAQLMATHWREDLLIAAGAALEKAFGSFRPD